jgi:CheY-like chemotaxis protein
MSGYEQFKLESTLAVQLPSRMKKLVYIVEDNPVQQKMLQVHFEQMLGNYTLRVFTNPDDMFATINEKPFDIVLDHFFSNKKNLTGLDYLRDLKINHPKIPIIYYTSASDDDIRASVVKLGVEQYIVKDSASLVRLRTALDVLHEKSEKKGFLKTLFSRK